ncbi:hypothetical protein BC835DRAFT_738298 [Cytidiella melzeri]|nr:hypothetical protein BC835DRAFT_738298 [Cytidiella melzeri]
MSYVDVQAWDEAYALRACNVVAATILVWEYLIHYDDEVELFWKKRWSFGKCVFLWSRYFSIAFVVGQAAAFLISRPSLAVSLRFFRWQDGATAVQIITSHVVLELRLYAMYRGIRWATIFIPSLAIIESIVSGVLFGLQYEGYNGNEPAPGVTLCADGDAKGKHLLMFFTTTTLTIEITLLSLALYQAWIHRHSMKGGIIRALLRGCIMTPRATTAPCPAR